MPKKQYQGCLLAANPNNPIDDLYKAVILLISHTNNIAIGVQINSMINNVDLQSVAENMDVQYDGDEPLWFGGNENNNKIHVIHSPDWAGMSTVRINDDLSVTNDVGIISAIARGEGPEYFRACAGYWIWHKGELDSQLNTKFDPEQPHKWEIAPATSELVFDSAGSEQWRYAIEDSAKSQIDHWM